ncbi:unnamed protein product [Caenorhabditis angaria]|uniref:Uncharacterized protein n=1 Tax=Caenorhabditis angaria TaxID=860376 RepID=A0A9P1J2Q0_9PELO|nr:unnamed protein product [Caenorhabditis angaria]
MNTSIVVALVLFITLAQANPARVRRDDRVERYCQKHAEHYTKFCPNKASVMDRGTYAKLAKFCPAFEKHCVVGKAGTSELPDMGTPLVMPPSLPKGSDFALLDLPIGEEAKPHRGGNSFNPQSTTRLTAAIIASCTPDCNAAHCTDECKCAHTHPKVHQMCNPPSSAQMAETCQRWYGKCTMFQPVQY